MRLRVEEDLGVHHPIGVRALEVGARKRMEIGGVAQHARPGIVDIEEFLQVAETVRRAQGLHARVAQCHAMARGEVENHRGLERALDVHVQLRLGNTDDEFVEGVLRIVHFGMVPSTPCTYQLMPITWSMGSVAPAATFSTPAWSLMGPWKGTNVPSVMALFLSS